MGGVAELADGSSFMRARLRESSFIPQLAEYLEICNQFPIKWVTSNSCRRKQLKNRQKAICRLVLAKLKEKNGRAPA